MLLKLILLRLLLLISVVQSAIILVVPDCSKSRSISSFAWIRGHNLHPSMLMRPRGDDGDYLPTSQDISSRRIGGHDTLDRMIAFVGTIAGGLALYETMGKLAI